MIQFLKDYLSKIFIFVGIVGIFSIIYSCKDDPSFGENILPPGDFLNAYYDSVSFDISNVRDDKYRTDSKNIGNIGVYTDSLFGKTSCSFATQFRLTTYNPTENSSIIYDSLELILAYVSETVEHRRVIGDPYDPKKIIVYELKGDLSPVDSNSYSKAYYANNVPEYYPEDIGSLEFIHDIANEEESVIKIPLSDEFTQKFIHEHETNLSTFTSNNSFLDFFKGIYVKPVDNFNNTSIVKFNLASNSKLRMHYTKPLITDSGTFDTHFIRDFGINSECGKYNIFQHDYSSSPFNDKLTNGTKKSDTLAFVQSMGGSKLIISFPDIEEIFSKIDYEIQIIDAVFSLQIENRINQDTVDIPENLMIYNHNLYTNDIASITGTLNTQFIRDSMIYVFHIPKLIQEIVDGENNELSIKPVFLRDKGSTSFLIDDDMSHAIFKSGEKLVGKYLILTYIEIQ